MPPAATNSQDQNFFVYGSLRTGGHNHWLLHRLQATFLSTAQIHATKHETGFPFPAISEGLGLVDGEVYATDANGIQALDFFESHPHFYQRRETTTTEGLKVWAYYGTGVLNSRPNPSHGTEAIEISPPL
jgi:gamma-glutamylaminecyclotransferase